MGASAALPIYKDAKNSYFTHMNYYQKQNSQKLSSHNLGMWTLNLENFERVRQGHRLDATMAILRRPQVDWQVLTLLHSPAVKHALE
jgi:hypothetical protein